MDTEPDDNNHVTAAPATKLPMRWNTFEDASTLAETLAERVASQLRVAIAARGQALLALSGGRTPTLFLQRLARQQLAWDKIIVTLVDERWVPPHHPRSNAHLIRENLLHGPPSQARFVPLYVQAPTPENALPRIAARIENLPLPLDVALLGMGGDGHTASFFPDGDHLAEALDPNATQRVLPMRAPGAGEPRITLTLPLLASARALYLQIQGKDKHRTLVEAIEGTDYPIRAMLRAAPDMQTYWCP